MEMEWTLWKAFYVCFGFILMAIYDVLVVFSGIFFVSDNVLMSGDFAEKYLKKFFPSFLQKTWKKVVFYSSFAICAIAIISIWFASLGLMAYLQHSLFMGEVTLSAFIKKALGYIPWNLLPALLTFGHVKIFGAVEIPEPSGGIRPLGVKPGPKPRMTDISVEPSTIMPPTRGIGTNPPPKGPRPPFPGTVPKSGEQYRKETEKEVK